MRVKIKNMGPVKSAEVDLKRLVLFVGPNNTGKSFIATVLYAALSQTGVASSQQAVRAIRRVSWDHVLDTFGDEDVTADFYSFVETAIKAEGRDSYSKMPEHVGELLKKLIDDSLREYIVSVAEEIVRTTGAIGIPGLRRVANRRATPATLSIASSNPSWEVEVKLRQPNGDIDVKHPADLHEIWRAIPPNSWRRINRQGNSRSLRLREFSSELARATFKEVPSHTKYLPAARSGLLQSHKALAGSLVRRSALAGIEDLRIPAMSGVVADFLSEMVELDSSTRGDFANEANRLEESVLHGQLGLRGDPDANPEVFYQTPSGDYPLARTSSMVSELAPVVLYLRYRLRQGDLLLVEEPEAHLHPGTQIALAKSLVRLINEGLRVVLTTHSEFFLQQLNNAIVAGNVRTITNGRSEIDVEHLKSEDVAAYLFSPSATGTTVSRLSIGMEEGVPDASFSEVSEHLYNEAVVLDRSIDRAAVG